MTKEHYLKNELYELIRLDSGIFEFLQAGSLDGIWYWDLEKPAHEWMSPRFWQVFGYDPAEKEHLAAEWQDMIHPEDLQTAIKNFKAHCENSDHPYDQTVRYRHKNGSTVWVRCRGIAIRDESGKPVRFLGAHSDVTALKAAEEEIRKLNEKLTQDVEDRTRELEKTQAQLLHAQKMEAIGRLAGGIAHDFNNLLMPIMGFAELLMSKNPSESLREDWLSEIRDCAERAKDLTAQLLAFGRKQVLVVKPIDLNELIRRSEKMLRRTIREEVEIRLGLSDAIGTVRADASQLVQVLVNLVVNSQDAISSTGRISIETRNVVLDEEYARTHKEVVPGPYVMMAVSDSGEGMSQEILVRIFEPFYTTKDQDRGTGLGLAMVYGIVKQLGGHIWVYSEPDKGTTFKVYFPQFEGPAGPYPVEAPSSAEAPRGTETILVAEDNDSVRRLATALLTEHGYKVLEAGSAEECRSIMTEGRHNVRLLLTDVIMPGMNGRQLFDELRKESPELSVLFMSGYTDDVVVTNGVLEPDSPFIQKPFPADELVRKVRTILDMGRHGSD